MPPSGGRKTGNPASGGLMVTHRLALVIYNLPEGVQRCHIQLNW